MKPSERATAEGVLYTDQYQFTMAQLYFRYGLHEKLAQFDHFFRSLPDYGTHQAGYCINAGLEWFVDWLQESCFRDEDIDYLRSQRSSKGDQLFDDDFLDWLKSHACFEGISLVAIPEGRVVHPGVPLTTVQGPLALAQIIETPLLNHLNYQTLIATKAARIHQAGQGQLMLEFGLRRAHEKSANAGARAALIGGADFSSNVGMSHILGLPPKGTHAHSMVQVFMALGEGELAAFEAYADIYPDDCLLLVDTVNTLHSGVPNAIKVFEKLKRKGHKPVGIRLDSGDLAYLSIQCAKMLNDAGFTDTSIVLSNQIDELVLLQILSQITEEAPGYGVDPDHLIKRLVYGVGTRMITSRGNGALDGVYKMVAIHDDGEWQNAIKLSETPEKVPTPGYKRVWRLYDGRQRATADLLALHDEDPHLEDPLTLRHPSKETMFRRINQDQLAEIEPLHVDVMREGELIYDMPPLDAIREQRKADLARLDSGVRRLVNPHMYHVSLTEQLWQEKLDLIRSYRSQSNAPTGD